MNFFSEKLELAGRWPPRNSFSDDYQQLVPAILKENEPSYLFCRFDVVGPHGLSWLMISYCPDSAPVRLKMLYASTRATVKSEFGDHYISEEKHCSTKVTEIENLIFLSLREGMGYSSVLFRIFYVHFIIGGSIVAEY